MTRRARWVVGLAVALASASVFLLWSLETLLDRSPPTVSVPVLVDGTHFDLGAWRTAIVSDDTELSAVTVSVKCNDVLVGLWPRQRLFGVRKLALADVIEDPSPSFRPGVCEIETVAEDRGWWGTTVATESLFVYPDGVTVLRAHEVTEDVVAPRLGGALAVDGLAAWRRTSVADVRSGVRDVRVSVRADGRVFQLGEVHRTSPDGHVALGEAVPDLRAAIVGAGVVGRATVQVNADDFAGNPMDEFELEVFAWEPSDRWAPVRLWRSITEDIQPPRWQGATGTNVRRTVGVEDRQSRIASASATFGCEGPPSWSMTAQDYRSEVSFAPAFPDPWSWGACGVDLEARDLAGNVSRLHLDIVEGGAILPVNPPEPPWLDGGVWRGAALDRIGAGAQCPGRPYTFRWKNLERPVSEVALAESPVGPGDLSPGTCYIVYGVSDVNGLVSGHFVERYVWPDLSSAAREEVARDAAGPSFDGADLAGLTVRDAGVGIESVEVHLECLRGGHRDHVRRFDRRVVNVPVGPLLDAPVGRGCAWRVDAVDFLGNASTHRGTTP